jgi:hypothetical protein
VSQENSRWGDDGIVGLLVMDPCMMGIWTRVILSCCLRIMYSTRFFKRRLDLSD